MAERQTGRRRAVLAAAGLALLVGLLAVPRLLYPPLSTADLRAVRDPEKRIELQQGQAKLENDARATLLQAIAGGLLVLGAIATWRQVRISGEQLEVARRQALDSAEQGRHELAVARDGQIAELFTRAIDQLGDDKLDIQLGGIYALERIARDSEPDRTTITRILAAFVRTHAPWPPRYPSSPTTHLPDRGEAPLRWLRDRAPAVDAALAALVRLPEPRDEHEMHLPLTDMHGAYLMDKRLPGALFRYSNLAGSVMDRVNLERGELQEVDLRQARLSGAHLAKARLRKANLEGALLIGADLRDAELNDANLAAADLRGADLRGANLQGARLAGTKLSGVRYDPNTNWPAGFAPDRRDDPDIDSSPAQPAGGRPGTL
jgi:Pentapeptide repeats (8 copies)